MVVLAEVPLLLNSSIPKAEVAEKYSVDPTAVSLVGVDPSGPGKMSRT